MREPDRLCAVARAEDGERYLIATRTIERDEIVISEEPTIGACLTAGMIPASYQAWLLVAAALEDPALLRWFQAVDFKRTSQTWDREDKRIAAKFARQFSREPKSIQDMYFRMVTNHVGVLDQSGRMQGTGLYETLCFANHSCSPNSEPQAPTATALGVALRAIAQIAPGEEITWDYFWPTGIALYPRRVRQKALLETLGFLCCCQKCCASGKRSG